MIRAVRNIKKRAMMSDPNTVSAVQASGTTITFNHTVEDQLNRILVVVVLYTDPSAAHISDVTFGGVGLSDRSDQVLVTEVGSDAQMSVWTLNNPAVGTGSIVITKGDAFSSIEQGIGVAFTLWNVDSTTGGFSSTSGGTGTSGFTQIQPLGAESIFWEATFVQNVDAQTDGEKQTRLGSAALAASASTFTVTFSRKTGDAAYNVVQQTTKSWTNSADWGSGLISFDIK